MSYKLFLDDYRQPGDAFLIENTVQKALNEIYMTPFWIVVKSYDEFVNYINENGLPALVSFDHDLADSHYRPLIDHYEHSPIDYSSYKEKTGYECAKWLCDYVMDNNIIEFPEYLVHSMNNVGAENIVGYIENFKKIVL